MCPALSTPVNGQISFSSLLYTANVTATYSCDTGFGLSGGDEVLTCGGDGSSPIGEWSGPPPVCDLICKGSNLVSNRPVYQYKIMTNSKNPFLTLILKIEMWSLQKSSEYGINGVCVHV